MQQMITSTLANLVLLFGIPFLAYYGYHRARHGRGLREVAERAGLRGSASSYLMIAGATAAGVVVILLLWPPSLEASTREGSAFRSFSGLGFGPQSVSMALLYGILKTGFSEEFLFRGLIGGSLARRMPLLWANLIQALIFLAPHMAIVLLLPEMVVILPFVFVGALLAGWIRIRSGSILGPWLIHAAANVAMALSIAVRTAA